MITIKKSTLKKYTVLLLYPDYATDAYGHETYLAWVKAECIVHALELAQIEASACASGSVPEDFHVLFTARGHVEDITGGEEIQVGQ